MSENLYPTGLRVTEVESLLESVKHEKLLAARIDLISSHFLNRPYLTGSLGGGPDLPETFSATFEGFDCVTYIETVMALAISETFDEFADALRKIRYEDGQVDWLHRNHYMTCWAMNNAKQGIISFIPTGPDGREKIRILNVVKGLPPRTVTLRFVPKSKLHSARKQIKTGDIILFVSTKQHLDVFHTGLLIVEDDEVLLRHATRSEGRVVEQPIEDFLKSHRMSGFILLRPICQH